MRFAMEHEYPDVKLIMNAVAQSLAVLTAEGDLSPEILVQDQSCKSG